MARKAPDVPLLPNDILYIPDNTGKRNLATVMDRVAGIGGTLGAASIYVLR